MSAVGSRVEISESVPSDLLAKPSDSKKACRRRRFVLRADMALQNAILRIDWHYNAILRAFSESGKRRAAIGRRIPVFSVNMIKNKTLPAVHMLRSAKKLTDLTS